MRSKRKPGEKVQVMNAPASGAKDDDDVDAFGDFDDLPSVKSRDLMSHMDSASEANSIKTPAKVNKATLR